MHIVPLVTFVAVASPAAYKTTRSVFGGWVASPDGCAKLGGLVLHAIVFMLIVHLIRRLRRTSYDRGSAMISQDGRPVMNNVNNRGGMAVQSTLYPGDKIYGATLE